MRSYRIQGKSMNLVTIHKLLYNDVIFDVYLYQIYLHIYFKSNEKKNKIKVYWVQLLDNFDWNQNDTKEVMLRFHQIS